MALVGPVLAVNSEKIGRVVFRSRLTKAAQPGRDRMGAEDIALVEAAMSGKDVPESRDEDIFTDRDSVSDGDPVSADPHAEQASQQSDEQFERKRDPEY